MINQDFTTNNVIQNTGATSDIANSQISCYDSVNLQSIISPPQPSVAGSSGIDWSETASKEEDEESLQDEIELVDSRIKGLDLQIRQMQKQRGLASENLLDDQEALSLLRQKNELQTRRKSLSMSLKRRRRKLLPVTGTTDSTLVVTFPLFIAST